MIDQELLKDGSAVRRLGIEALTEKLGHIGMIEFMRQFNFGYGDYTKEREALFEGLTTEDIVSEIKKMKETRQQV